MALISSRIFRPKAMVNSFLGLLDIKSGAEIILLFGLLNKVAGVYGLISLFTGGDIYQLSFYFYSSVTAALFVWGMRAVSEESSSHVLTLCHLYFIDHIVQSLYTLHFGITYWNSPHDGRRVINSQAQKDMIDLAISRGEVGADREGGEALAMGLWKEERGTAALVLVAAWLIKIYFIIVLYSYAAHLRKNTYHSLPLSSSPPKPTISTMDEQVEIITSAETEGDGTPLDVGGKGKGKARIRVGDVVEEEFRWESDDDEEGGEDVGRKKDMNSRD